MVYIFNFLLIPFYYFLISYLVQNKEKSNRYFFILAGVHIVLFRALANPYIFKDTLTYAEAFLIIEGMSFKEAVLSINMFTGWGQGYVALNWFIGQFTSDPAYLFIVLAIVSVGGVILYYYKTSYTPFLTVIFYLLYPMMYIMGFGVVRQHLAVVFVLWALYYMDNIKIAIPLTIIGVLCHTSAIIVIPFFFIRNFNVQSFNSVKLYIYLLGGFLLASLGAGYVLSFSSRYENVLESEGTHNNIIPVIVIGFTILCFLISGALQRIKDKKEIYIFRFLVFGLIVALYGSSVSRAGRASIYFLYVVPVAFSLLYKYSFRDTKWVFFMCTLVLFSIELLLVRLAASKCPIYHFLWE